MRHVLEWQHSGFDDLTGVQGVQGNLCGRDEPEIGLVVVVEVALELWQVSGPRHRLLADEQGRIYLRVAVGPDVDVQHP